MVKKKLVEEHQIERVDASTPRGEGFEDPDAVCGKCGGLPYDIVFTRGDVQYKFCLYKIQRDGKILAETDYEKLYEYTKKNGEMMNLRKKKNMI